MLSLTVRVVAVLVTLATTMSVTSVSHAADYQPPEEITPEDGTVTPLKNAALIEMTEGGFRYKAGQQNSRLTVTVVGGKLRFADTGTQELRRFPGFCREQRVTDGIAALCTIPQKFIDADSMFLEVWPRLGDDVVDGRALPDMIRLWMLMDTGRDKMLGGAGDDFANGGAGNDRARGGAGNDRLRLGVGNDQLWGDAGNDTLVATHDNDILHGGAGIDEMYGGDGADMLDADGDAGSDTVSCKAGEDTAYVDRADRVVDCENVIYPAVGP